MTSVTSLSRAMARTRSKVEQLGLHDRDGDVPIAHGLCRSRNQAGSADERSWYSVVISMAELMER